MSTQMNTYRDSQTMSPEQVKTTLIAKLDKDFDPLIAKKPEWFKHIKDDVKKTIDEKTTLMSHRTTSETDYKKIYNELKKELKLERDNARQTLKATEKKKFSIKAKFAKAKRGDFARNQ